MAESAALKGYAETTIADIVREAGVSRRTFYEHFETKAECLVALYEAASLQALAVLAAGVDDDEPWQAQVERALGDYFSWMAQNPALLRTLFVEILGLGAEGLTVRRLVHEQIARFVIKVVNAAPGAPAISPQLASAIVGGISELVLEKVEQGRAAEMASLAPVASDFVLRVARGN